MNCVDSQLLMESVCDVNKVLNMSSSNSFNPTRKSSTDEENFIRLWSIIFSSLPHVCAVFKRRWKTICGENWTGRDLDGAKLYDELCKNKFMKTHLSRAPHLKEKVISGCTDKWDMTLLHSICRHFPDNCSKHQEENNAIENIKEIRNFLAHLNDGRVSSKVYQEKLGIILCSLEILNVDSGFVKNIHKSVSDPKKYTSAPSIFAIFLDADENILIISTVDCFITSEKIQEHRSDIMLFDSLNFLNHASCSEAKINQKLPVVTVHDGFGPMLKTAKNLRKKIVIITTRKIKEIQNCLKEMKIKTALVASDFAKWSDLTPIHQYLIASRLEDMLNLNAPVPYKVLKSLQDIVLIDLINGKIPKTLHEFPKQQIFYLQRKLIPRAILSKRIFTSETLDVFLFTGIERSELANFARENVTSMSSLQCQKLRPTSRYIILEKLQHFDEISRKTDHPVHLVSYKQGRLYWIKSDKNVTCLHKCLEDSQEAQSEEEFVKNICTSKFQNQPICIIDSAGMGKSQLLVSIGNKLLENDKNEPNHVFFISANSFISKLMKKLELSDVNIELIRSCLAESVSLHGLGKFVVENLLKSGEANIELLLDGFDEIDLASREIAYRCIKIIKNELQSARLWQTSRPHVILPLENCLGVLGCKIEMFDRPSQINFLVSSWSDTRDNHHLNSDMVIWSTFAKTCLDMLLMNTNAKDIEIAGIPLQCKLIAEIYKDDAINYANQEDNFEIPMRRIRGPSQPEIRKASVTDLYIRVIEKKIKIYLKRYNILNRNTTYFMNYHKYLGLKLLFPGIAAHLKALLTTDEISEQDILNIGIVELGEPHQLEFIHRTFAEYFVATFVVEMVTKVNSDLALAVSGLIYEVLDNYPVKMEFLGYGKLTSILEGRKFKHRAICHFIEHLLTGVGGFTEFMSPLLRTHFIGTQEIVNVAKTCLYEDNKNILLFCQHFNATQEDNDNYLFNVFNPETLLICMRQCNLDVIMLICEGFKNIGKVDITSGYHITRTEQAY